MYTCSDQGEKILSKKYEKHSWLSQSSWLFTINVKLFECLFDPVRSQVFRQTQPVLTLELQSLEMSCIDISLPDCMITDEVSSSPLTWSLVTQLRSWSRVGRSRCCLCNLFECRLTSGLLLDLAVVRVVLLQLACLRAISVNGSHHLIVLLAPLDYYCGNQLIYNTD